MSNFFIKLPKVSGGGGGGGSWGSITGTLSNQTDLQSALNLKANTSSLATVATTGSYNDLLNKPVITPANVLVAGVDSPTLQGTINLANTMSPSSAKVIVIQVPPKNGGWVENITLYDSIVLRALANDRDTNTVAINGTITYNTVSNNPVTARSSISGFLVSANTAASVITFGGTNGGQFSIDGCFIQNTNTSLTSAAITTNSAGSLYLYSTRISLAASPGTGGIQVVANGTVYSPFGFDGQGGTKSFDIKAGKYVQINAGSSICNGAEAVTIATNGVLAAGTFSFVNQQANGTGINLTATGAAALMSNSYVDVLAGTGYVITGVAGTVYGNFNNFTGNLPGVQTRNVKIKSTVTSIAYTSALTSSP